MSLKKKTLKKKKNLNKANHIGSVCPTNTVETDSPPMPPMGRPTLYRPEYCEQIIKFFNREPSKKVSKKVYDKKSQTVMEVEVLEPCRLPTFEKFAWDLGVHTDTLLDWCKVHESFFQAYQRCKVLQKEIMMQNALGNLYAQAYSIFASQNLTDMRNRKELDHKSSDGSFNNKQSIVNINLPNKNEVHEPLEPNKSETDNN